MTSPRPPAVTLELLKKVKRALRTSEIGVTVLDTRYLVEKAIKDWEKDFHSFHFRTNELMEVRCGDHARAKCNPGEFKWGARANL